MGGTDGDTRRFQSLVKAVHAVVALDDLTLLASITGRWPPTPPHSQVDGPPSAPEELEAGDAAEPPLSPEVAAKLAGGAPISAAETNADEPETDEMDSV